MTDNYLQTDEANDVSGSIRHAVRCIDFLERDQLTWKWVFLSIHSALQGACVCHLTTTAAPVGAVTKKNAAEWLTYFEESREQPNLNQPETKLMVLPDLLKAVRKPNSIGSSGFLSQSSNVAVSDSELDSLTRFHKSIRNQFTHFEPMGWSIELSGASDLIHLATRIIDDIELGGWGFRHLDPGVRTQMKVDLELLRATNWLECSRSS